jgi:hypothetical protein
MSDNEYPANSKTIDSVNQGRAVPSFAGYSAARSWGAV